MLSFSEMKLGAGLLESLERIGFTTPTEVQVRAVPALLEGRDVIGQSKTGSGKTAAYMLPILELLKQKPGKVCLVMVPTRELAIQVEEFCKKLSSKAFPIRTASILGGDSYGRQMACLRLKPEVIVATPGRLVDHLDRKTIQLNNLGFLVFDEADRMFDMGFYPQIKEVLEFIPKDKQAALFSATFTNDVKRLAREVLVNPVEIQVGDANAAPTTIEQQVIETTMAEKNELLLNELNAREGSVLVFAKTKIKTEKIGQFLDSYGFKVCRIHGDRTLFQRKQAIELFRSGRSRVLVATDIAARGLDISQVGHVINFDLPQNPEDYLHRIGRTGRAGASGKALSFVTPEERGMWRMIARKAGLPFTEKPSNKKKFGNNTRRGDENRTFSVGRKPYREMPRAAAPQIEGSSKPYVFDEKSVLDEVFSTPYARGPKKTFDRDNTGFNERAKPAAKSFDRPYERSTRPSSGDQSERPQRFADRNERFGDRPQRSSGERNDKYADKKRTGNSEYRDSSRPARARSEFGSGFRSEGRPMGDRPGFKPRSDSGGYAPRTESRTEGFRPFKPRATEGNSYAGDRPAAKPRYVEGRAERPRFDSSRGDAPKVNNRFGGGPRAERSEGRSSFSRPSFR